MAKYLVSIVVEAEHQSLLEACCRMAANFLATSGRVERADLGVYGRIGRANRPEERLALATFACAGDEAATRAKPLEDVLRRTLASGGSSHGEVRVFLELPKT